ncbi:MAG: hypothetical protein K1Y02_09605 [Candidatus Hydrogenedentes bacterium]|nr:hypothetical protein [Candidatus Hydrogenedentota bacterium]
MADHSEYIERHRNSRQLPALAAAIPTGAIALAVGATIVALAFWLLKQREARKSSTFVEREVTFFLMALTVFGFAAGCWAFVVYARFAA